MKSIVSLCIIISVLRNGAFFATSSESIVKRSAIESTLSKDTGDEAPPPEQKTPPHKKTPTVAPEPSPSKPKTIPKAPSPSNPKAPSPSKSKSKPPPRPTSALEARQLAALQTLGVPLAKDPCSAEYISCDDAKPERHVTYLSMEYCSPQTLMTADAMDALSTLVSLSFVHCAISPLRKLPSKLADSLTSFTCTSSLGKTTEDTQMQGLSGVWLAQMRNLTKLTVTDVMVNASKVGVVVSNMKHLRDITMSRTNISGSLPKKWHPNVTYIDLSSNNISGEIPPSIGKLFHVRSLDLSSNELDGHIPSDIAKMVHLTKLSLASNKLSGPLPTSFAEMPSLEYLDLSGNTLNGSIPEYLSRLSSLRYLNLENNDFSGTMPFNASFVKRLSFFKIGGNANVCYNHSAFPSKLKLGIPVCDSSGLPAATSGPSTSKGAVSPSADAPSSSDDDEDGGPEDERGSSPPSHHHGPNKVVIGIAISLSLVFLICSCIFLSIWCSRRA